MIVAKYLIRVCTLCTSTVKKSLSR